MQRTVQDVMTRDVVVAHESALFHELVELLRRHRVNALPVVDDACHVLGIVCESDLVLKEVQTLKGPCDPQELTSRHRLERAKAAATTAAQVMTAPVVRSTRRSWSPMPRAACTPASSTSSRSSTVPAC
jgi:CBS-domain-containing membrane protein